MGNSHAESSFTCRNVSVTFMRTPDSLAQKLLLNSIFGSVSSCSLPLSTCPQVLAHCLIAPSCEHCHSHLLVADPLFKIVSILPIQTWHPRSSPRRLQKAISISCDPVSSQTSRSSATAMNSKSTVLLSVQPRSTSPRCAAMIVSSRLAHHVH